MTDDTIREAVARALCSLDCPPDGHPCDVGCSGICLPGKCRRTWLGKERADAALSALPVTAATLADIAAGRAVVVPRVATPEIIAATPANNISKKEKDSE